MKNFLPLSTILFLLSSLLFTQSMSAENHIRIVNLKYIVYNPETDKIDKEIDAIDGYEVLPGHWQLGKIKPVAVFQNMTDDKELQFYIGLKIINEYRGEEIYRQSGIIDLMSLYNPDTSNIQYIDADGNALPFPAEQYKNGLPPGGYVKVYFEDFIPVDSLASNHGRLTLTAFSMNLSYPENTAFPKEDISDDTLAVRLESICISWAFRDRGEDYISKNGKYIPKPNIWISKGVEVVDGNEYCYFPHNSIHSEWDSTKEDYIVSKCFTPVYRMNRVDLEGNEYDENKRGGDCLLSQIIDYRMDHSLELRLTYQRLGKILDNFRRGWSDEVLYGPEHRVIVYGDDNNQYREPDELILEYAFSSYDNKNKLVNIKEEDWNVHPRKGGGEPIRNNPIFTLFGGGGYRRGYLEYNQDSALTYKQGLREDIFDDGKDKYFKTAFISLPFFVADSGLLRLRIRVNAKNDGQENIVSDDHDDFFLDEIFFTFGCGCGEVSFNSINIQNPYSIIPIYQKTEIPVSVTMTDNAAGPAPSFLVLLRIKHDDCPKWPLFEHEIEDTNKVSYAERKMVNWIQARSTRNILMPPLNLNDFKDYIHPGENKFQAWAVPAIPGTDHDTSNDTLYSEFTINIGDVFAYDLPVEGRNDVPEFSGIKGRGLGLPAFSLGNDEDYNAFGSHDFGGSGRLAMRFELSEQDTVFGVQSYFGILNQAGDDISYSIYKDKNGLPGELIEESTIYRLRGFDEIRKDYFFAEYVTYLYDNPLILPAGKYWAAIGQLAETGFELGASAGRMGMLTTVFDCLNIEGDQTIYGKYGTSLNLDKNLRKIDTVIIDNQKRVGYINDIVFAYENTRGSGDWKPFTPTVGNPAYSHLDHSGTIKKGHGNYRTFSRGSFIPMIRIYMDGSHYKPDNVESYDKPRIKNIAIINIFPNPVENRVAVEYSINRSVNVEIALFDAYDNRVIELFNGKKESGTYYLSINAKNLPSGNYFCRMSCGGYCDIKTVVVTK